MSLDALEVLFEETCRKVPTYLQDKCHAQGIDHGQDTEGLAVI